MTVLIGNIWLSVIVNFFTMCFIVFLSKWNLTGVNIAKENGPFMDDLYLPIMKNGDFPLLR